MGMVKSKLSPKLAGPFGLDDSTAYRSWRADKLRHYPESVDELRVPVAHLSLLGPAQHEAIVAACRRANFAVYQSETRPSMEELRDFGEVLGLVNFDQHLWAPQEGMVELRQARGPETVNVRQQRVRGLRWDTLRECVATHTVTRRF